MGGPTEGTPDDNQPAGANDRERLAAAAEDAQRALTNQIAIARAEGIVNDARGLALLAEQDAAAHVLDAARATAWAAEQAGDRAGLEAAWDRVLAAQATFARVTAEAVQEVNGISEAQRDRAADLVAQFRRTWAAIDAADALTRRPGQQH